MIASSYNSFQDNSTHGEDSFIVRDLGENIFLDVVLDGVTGHGGGEASQSVAQALEEAQITSIDDVIAILSDMNDDFFQVGGGKYLLTTASIALYSPETIHIVNAGDSPIYHITPDSHRHIASRLGGILKSGGTKLIGADNDLHISQTEIPLQVGDKIVIASDGVSDNVSLQELLEITRSASTPEAASTELKALIDDHLSQGLAPQITGARYRHDDQTAIIRFF
ncbi:MAG: SpoIIE family protein phosphatase [Chloroflexota bacterium]|nr:SpoIIE family protein phosphatase [Chloroflexota bacterium]